MNSVFSALMRERSHAFEQDRPIVHIRVTTDAFAGSITTMPVSPERARTLGKLWAFPDGTIEAAYDGRALEILMHPEDYMEALKDIEAAQRGYVQMPLRDGEPERIMGIAVSR